MRFFISSSTGKWAIQDLWLPFLLIGIFCFSNSCPAIEGFYKDLFVDGGVNLTNRRSLAAANYLNLSMEYLATEEQYIQDELIVLNDHDDNGVLLFPDGSPRFRCIQVNGGSATNHGKSLGDTGRRRIRDFYLAGGCYTGTCAGCFIVANGYNNYTSPYYLKLWPARARTTGLSDIYTGHFIPGDSPLLDYYTFGDDLYIDNVRHNYGAYAIKDDPDHWSPGTSLLLRYDYPEKKIHNHPSSWAWKEDEFSGRLAVIGSHPEGETTGEKRDLMAAIIQYAMDGRGRPITKGVLDNDITRSMNDNDKIGFEKIGDRQYHHFLVEVPAAAQNLEIILEGDDEYNLDLFLLKGDFAFKGKPGVISADEHPGAHESITITGPSPGTWYVAVKCVTTVTTIKKNWGYSYTGKLDVLNGVEYSISASWETATVRNGWLFY